MNIDYSYALTPFLSWIFAGVMKFVLNSMKGKVLAFGAIGYGGFPSNHSAIVSSMVTLIALKEGFGHPAFGVAITVAFIVILDAHSLRREVGKHAAIINVLALGTGTRERLRERVGHSLFEIGAGIGVGIGVAVAVHALL